MSQQKNSIGCCKNPAIHKLCLQPALYLCTVLVIRTTRRITFQEPHHDSRSSPQLLPKLCRCTQPIPKPKKQSRRCLATCLLGGNDSCVYVGGKRCWVLISSFPNQLDASSTTPAAILQHPSRRPQPTGSRSKYNPANVTSNIDISRAGATRLTGAPSRRAYNTKI